MRRIVLLILLAGLAGPALARDCVVLLHGLARTASSMDKMQEALADADFETANIDYPSREHTIEELADTVIPRGIAACSANGDVGRIHFVTHSLGGILLRQYLRDNRIDKLGRVVMLGPPNQGTVAADELQGVPGFDWLNGPAGRQLGKGEDSVPLRLGPAEFEVGIIAGSRTIDPLTSTVLDNPDDGRVSVDDTRLDGMSDFIVVEHSHAFMMRMRGPIELTIRFLNSGSFRD
ncbi:MAG: alpha/beta fold hydrolase [Gammaproteobacteria bacterium]|nr:alpha/beta fold hydrolase [Gammaproteobacteria bacterium]